MTNDLEKLMSESTLSTNQFIVSHRRAGKRGGTDALKSGRDSFERVCSQILANNVDLLSHNEGVSETNRGMKIFTADYLDVNRIKKEFPSDMIIERIITRKPAIASPFNVSLSAYQPLGKGNRLELSAIYFDKPLAGITMRVNFAQKNCLGGECQNATDSRETDIAGKALFEYDGDVWSPVGLMCEPNHSYWTPAPISPPFGPAIKFIPLSKTGPLGWWHQAIGISAFDPNFGSGIKVGIVDTGVGPNANLSKIKSIGSFIDGKHDNSLEAGWDCGNHGTHVGGIIAGLPFEQSNDYAGIVPGAEVYAARVFPKNLSATQGDIANAIETLVLEHGVHLINMSLGAAKPSAIELDAIQFAMEYGTLCICAAGNSAGPVFYPAAYNETVAVSALGLMGMYPSDTLSFWFTPKSADKFGAGGFFLASYSNFGDAIVCCAPGTGIISTVPQVTGYPAPYLAMDGTSMSCPIVTGALAAVLAQDEEYKAMVGNSARSAYAAQVAIVSSSHSLNLQQKYQGYGLTQFHSMY